MVEVQVAVDDRAMSSLGRTGRCQRLPEWAPAWLIVRLGLRIDRTDAGVEQEQTIAVIDQVAQDRFGARVDTVDLDRRPYVLAQGHPPDAAHPAMMRPGVAISAA
nr:hypothetical protein [Fodinicola feengrottensis]